VLCNLVSIAQRVGAVRIVPTRGIPYPTGDPSLAPAEERAWRRELLERSFALQGYSAERMKRLFGALLEAFDYGPPPHGGIAIGIDRWSALLTDQDNIREVTAFPKTQSGSDLMLEAPSKPEPGQWAELGLRFVGVAEPKA